MKNSVPPPLAPNPDHVYLKYNTGGEVWASPLVAAVAIDRGQAKRIDPPNQQQKS